MKEYRDQAAILFMEPLDNRFSLLVVQYYCPLSFPPLSSNLHQDTRGCLEIFQPVAGSAPTG
jgi:hypothetical protein